jgi:hypothetical protein
MHRFGAARRLVGSRVRVVTFEKDRVCAITDCATRLSIYNPDPFCALHTEQAHLSSYSGR